MRHKRTKQKNSKKRERLFTVLVFFVFAPLVAILIAGGIIRYVILPQFTSGKDTPSIGEDSFTGEIKDDTNGDSERVYNEDTSENTSEETNETQTFNREPLILHNIQVGSFSDLENAQVLATEIKKKGFPGYIVKNENFKVFAGSFANKEEAQEYIVAIREGYQDAFISTLVLNEGVIKYPESDQPYIDQIFNLLTEIDNRYTQEASIWASAVQKDDYSFIKKTLTENTNYYKTEMAKFNEKITGDYLKELSSKLQNFVENREGMISNLENNNLNATEGYTQFNQSYFNFIGN